MWRVRRLIRDRDCSYCILAATYVEHEITALGIQGSVQEKSEDTGDCSNTKHIGSN
jgi:hypothetical protein